MCCIFSLRVCVCGCATSPPNNSFTQQDEAWKSVLWISTPAHVPERGKKEFLITQNTLLIPENLTRWYEQLNLFRKKLVRKGRKWKNTKIIFKLSGEETKIMPKRVKTVHEENKLLEWNLMGKALWEGCGGKCPRYQCYQSERHTKLQVKELQVSLSLSLSNQLIGW